MIEIMQQAENIAFDVTMAHDQDAANKIVASALLFERKQAASTIEALVAALDSIATEMKTLAARKSTRYAGLHWAIVEAERALSLARGEG